MSASSLTFQLFGQLSQQLFKSTLQCSVEYVAASSHQHFDTQRKFHCHKVLHFSHITRTVYLLCTGEPSHCYKKLPHLPSIPVLFKSYLLLHSQGNHVLQQKDSFPVSMLSTHNCTVCYSLHTKVRVIKIQTKTGHYTLLNLLCSLPPHIMLSMDLSLCLSSSLFTCFLTFTLKIYYPPNYQLYANNVCLPVCLYFGLSVTLWWQFSVLLVRQLLGNIIIPISLWTQAAAINLILDSTFIRNAIKSSLNSNVFINVSLQLHIHDV